MELGVSESSWKHCLLFLYLNSALSEKGDFEDKLKELQSVCDPIIAQVYQAAGGQNPDADEDFEEDL